MELQFEQVVIKSTLPEGWDDIKFSDKIIEENWSEENGVMIARDENGDITEDADMELSLLPAGFRRDLNGTVFEDNNIFDESLYSADILDFDKGNRILRGRTAWKNTEHRREIVNAKKQGRDVHGRVLQLGKKPSDNDPEPIAA